MSSNDYSQVRDYIRTRMAIVEPTYKEWEDALDVEAQNIPKTLLDTSYHLTFNAATSTQQIDRHIVDSFPVVISIFRRTYNSQAETRDAVMQTANCIRLDLISPANVEEFKAAQDGNIETVISESITPTEIDGSNDNIIKVEIGLSFQLYFGVI